MSYPSSQPVEAGDPTRVDQYNNLRNDAIYFGADASESGTLRDLLYNGVGSVRLSRSAAARIRLSASESEPCGVMIGGKILTASANQEITISSIEYAAGKYGLYAVAQRDGSFVLEAGAEAPSNGRKIGSFIWTGTGILPGSVRSEAEEAAAARRPASDGRLSLTYGNPAPAYDIRDAQYIYFTPYKGNEIGIYTAGGWENYSFSELSLSVRGLDAMIPYDIFVTVDENGLALVPERWATGTSRGVDLRYQDGIRVSGSVAGRRYLGTIALNEAGYAEDSLTGRMVWNENNRLSRALLSPLITDVVEGYVYENTWVPYYENAAPEVRILLPNDDGEFTLNGVGVSSMITEMDAQYTRYAALGIGLDMIKTAPYTGNTTCVPVYTHSYGNGPLTVTIVSGQRADLIGLHRYTLAWFSTYTMVRPNGQSYKSACGETPGLQGAVRA